MSDAEAMLAVDVGGTFTDVISVRGAEIEAIKVPTNRARSETSVIEGARELGVADRSVFNHASTAGLNALLTRGLPKVGFITTRGHRDVLDQARSFRPFEALTDAGWRKPFGDARAPLVPRYLRRGVTERIKADGEALVGLDEAEVVAELERFGRCGIEGLAVCLLNAYVDGRHERRIRELATDVLGGIPCSISSEVSPLAKEYPRATTTVVDAFMKIVYGAYAERLAGGLGDLGFAGELNFADSAATLMSRDYAMQRPFKLVFGGPAAGTVAAAHLGSRLGWTDLLCCDVGGTSSDISIVTAGAPVLNTSFEIEPELIVNSPSIELASVGAGGGSQVFATPAGEIRVGPESAGAEPGPACYGRGGTIPTMTDALLLIGLLDGSRFNDGKLALDEAGAREAFTRLTVPLSEEERISHAYRLGLNNVAEGILDVCVRRGIDPRGYSLVAFGAAGPVMLPAVMPELGVQRVIVPPFPGLFSALGLLSADRVYADSLTSYTLLGPGEAAAVATIFAELERRVRAAAGGTVGEVRRSFDARLVGQSWETDFVAAPAGDLGDAGIERMRLNFHDEYERRYDNRFEDYPVEAVTFRVEMMVPSSKVSYPSLPSGGGRLVEPQREIELAYLDERDRRAGEYEREALVAGDEVRGPAVIRERTSTTHVPCGQAATVGELGELILEVTR